MKINIEGYNLKAITHPTWRARMAFDALAETPRYGEAMWAVDHGQSITVNGFRFRAGNRHLMTAFRERVARN